MIENQLQETIQHIRQSTQIQPTLGFVLGSGLAAFANEVKNPTVLSFNDLPHFAKASVEGHPGRLILGEVAGVPAAVLQGRLHAYEGHPLSHVIYPVRVLAQLGVKTLVVTNAAGSLKTSMKPGHFMVIKDHINLTGENPLRGPNWSAGQRFVDMTEPYDVPLSKLLKQSLNAVKARSSEGVYVGVMGPTYETAAEIRFFAKIGGSAVGMSTVAEVMAARHAGVKVVGLSCITNLGTGLSKTKLSHEEVKDIAGKVESVFAKALIHFVNRAKKRL